MSKDKTAGQPASFKVTTSVAAFYPLPAVRESQPAKSSGNVRVFTHRLLLNPSPSLLKAKAACAEHERENSNGEVVPVGFGTYRNDGLIAIDMDGNTISTMLRNVGMTAKQFQRYGKGASFTMTVELRLEGEETVDIRTGEMIPITLNHTSIQNPAVAVADSIIDRIERNEAVAEVMLAREGTNVPAPVATPAAPQQDELPEESEVQTTRKAPAKVPAGKRTASTTKVG